MGALASLLFGLALLIAGAELVVRGSSRVAGFLGVRPLLIGLTIVAVGTSAPELAVGITASRHGHGALAVGNIAGTNIFNILFILGLSALARPLPIQMHILKLELPAMGAAAILLAVLSWDGRLSQLDGAGLLSAAVLYTAALIRMSRREDEAVKEVFLDRYGQGDRTWQLKVLAGAGSVTLLGIGLVIIVTGADWLVEGAAGIARAMGVSEAIIGLTIVAIGTSAPELATTVVATLRDQRDVAVGNLVGSSIYNILVILGVTCLAAPGGMSVPRQILLVDFPLGIGVALICVPVFITGRVVSRLEGALFVAAYGVYLLSIALLRA